MRVTRFGQSCLLIENKDTRILIDAGVQFTSKHDINELGNLDGVLITHEHADHFDEKMCSEIATNTDIYANESTAKLINGPKKIVKDQQEISIGQINIKVIELPHCLMPDGSEGPQNTGFLIDEMLFHPGDGIELEGLSVKNLALPITGPDVSIKKAFQFARQLSAEHVIPIHYDVFGANVDLYARFAKKFNQPFKMSVLGDGESIDL